MAATQRPAKKNKLFRISGGGKEVEEDSAALPSFSFMMPPSKKAKKLRAADNNDNGKKSNDSYEGGDSDVVRIHQVMLSSPAEVLGRPATTNAAIAAAINNNGRRQEEMEIKTLPPSLRGITEAAKMLHSSSHMSSSQQQQHPPSQLVAFPTESLYVLTCCVKTTSLKKLLLANTSAASRNRDDSEASRRSSCSSSSAGEEGAKENKETYRADFHPRNPSLEHLLSRLGSNQAAPSVFVIDNKHAQHYCHFSSPKRFAIRPKQLSGSVPTTDSFLNHRGGCCGEWNNNGGEGQGCSCESRSSQLLKQEKQVVGCSEESSYSSYSPVKSAQSKKPMTVTPSPKKSCTIQLSTSSSSLFVPTSPKVTPTTPSSMTAATHAVTPIANNIMSIAIAQNNSKIPTMLQLPTRINPTNSNMNNDHGAMNKIHAVTFSESYEAFSRLTQKFWPGPMIIYAPARMVSVGNGSGGQQHHSLSRSSSSGSNASSPSFFPSIPSFTNLDRLGKNNIAEVVGEVAKNLPQVPVLPPSVLIPARDLLLGSDDCNDHDENKYVTDDQRFFIGMQCPSHPLSRKILTEIHRPRGFSSTTTSSPISQSPSTDSLVSCSSLDTPPFHQHRQGKQQQQIRCGIAVVGSYIPPLTVASSSSDWRDDQGESDITLVATTAANVKEILSPCSSSPSPEIGCLHHGTEQICIVNGEDTTRESFSVPTCNYGGTYPISLVLDGANRTIHMLRSHGDGVNKKCSNFTKETIYRSLLQSPSSSWKSNSAIVNVDNGSNKAASTRREIDRVITAVLSRWTVVERDV